MEDGISNKDSFEKGSEYNEKKSHVEDSAGRQGSRRRSSLFDISGGKDLNAVFENPLAGVEPEQLMKEVTTFCEQYGLMDVIETVKKGALVARNPENGPNVEGLTESERQALIDEKARKWHHPFML